MWHPFMTTLKSIFVGATFPDFAAEAGAETGEADTVRVKWVPSPRTILISIDIHILYDSKNNNESPR